MSIDGVEAAADEEDEVDELMQLIVITVNITNSMALFDALIKDKDGQP